MKWFAWRYWWPQTSATHECQPAIWYALSRTSPSSSNADGAGDQAVVLGPVLMRRSPKEETLETLMADSAKVVDTVKEVIDHWSGITPRHDVSKPIPLIESTLVSPRAQSSEEITPRKSDDGAEYKSKWLASSKRCEELERDYTVTSVSLDASLFVITATAHCTSPCLGSCTLQICRPNSRSAKRQYCSCKSKFASSTTTNKRLLKRSTTKHQSWLRV